MKQNGTTETTPLLAPPPITADASPEAQLDRPDDDEASKIDIAERPTLSKWRLAVSTAGLAGLIFLQATNISMLSVISRQIRTDLQLRQYESPIWFTSAYLIAMSALGPLNGKLAAIFSPRACILVASILLGLGTLISGMAKDFIHFIVGRVITGIGASGIFTVSTILVLELASIERRGLAVGLLNTGYTIGVATGAVVAGALVAPIGWRNIFIAQTPIALVCGTVLFFSIPAHFTTKRRSTKPIRQQLARLDYAGAIMLTTAIVLFLYALSAEKTIPWEPLVLSPIFLAVFLIVELHIASDPLIPVALLGSRGLLLSCLATVGYMMARWTVLFYTPAYALSLRSWSEAGAGAVLVPTNGGFALGGILVGWLHIRRHGSFYVPTLIMYIIFPITLAWLAALTTHNSSVILFILDVFICGFVTGAALNYSLAHVLHMTPESTHYVATSLLNTFRGFSGSFGSAIGGGLFTRTLYQNLVEGFAAHNLQRDELIQELLTPSDLVQSLDGVEHEVAVAAYETAFRSLFLAGAALSAVTVLVQAGVGWRAAPQEVVVEETDRRVDDRGASQDLERS